MHVHLEAEARAENILPQQAIFPRLGNGLFEPLLCQLVLTAHIEKTFICPHRVGGDGHGFQQAVRVAFQDDAVFKSAGFAFIGVADNIFLRGFRSRHEAPFGSSWETRPAASLQARFFQFRDDFHACLADCFCQGLVPVFRNVFLDVFRVNSPGPSQDNTFLHRLRAFASFEPADPSGQLPYRGQ